MAESKKTVTISLKVPEIIYDIQNKTYLIGRSHEASNEKDFISASNMQASDDEENSYQLRRSVTAAFARVKVEYGEYLDEVKSTADNLISAQVDSDGELTLGLKMPSNFNPSAVDSIGASLHEYIVQTSIFDFLNITNKAMAADYKVLAESAMLDAKKALYKRARPTRPAYATPDAPVVSADGNNITISCATAGAYIDYSIDGADYQAYTGTIAVAAAQNGKVLCARATKDGMTAVTHHTISAS